MQIAELVLEYVKAFVWPAVVTGIVIVFRAQIRDLTRRILSVSAGGVEARFDQVVSDAARVTVPGVHHAVGSNAEIEGSASGTSAARREQSIRSFRPKVYGDLRQIAEAYRDGHAITMDVTSANDLDAKRMVDFAAGLIFSARGSIQRVSDRVFLLEQPTE